MYPRAGDDKIEAKEEEEVWARPLSETVNWLGPEAWVEDMDATTSRNLNYNPPQYEEADIELPLVVVDVPLLPTGSHSIAVTDANLERLYDHILLSGGRRFVVTLGESEAERSDLAKGVLSSVDDELEYAYNVAAMDAKQDGVSNEAEVSPGDDSVRLAEVGSVLYVTDVKDTEAGTRIYEHTVQVDRVRIRKVSRRDGRLICRAAVARDAVFVETRGVGDDLPPPDTSTFAGMLARFELLNVNIQELLLALSARKQQRRRPRTTSRNRDNPAHERIVLNELAEIASLQKQLDEDVCFREEAISALGAGVGSGIGSLWHLANSCWLSYLKARATTRARRVYAELHDRLVDFLARTGRLPPDFLSGREAIIVVEQRPELALSISELPTELQRDLLRLKTRVADELQPIIAQQKAAQLLLQAHDHKARCLAFASLLRSEKRRLQAKASLRNLLSKPPDSQRSGDDHTKNV